MATSNRTLFDYFLNKVEDRDLCKLLTDEDIINILDMYRKNTTSLYFTIIKTDISSVKSPEFYRQDFNGDGIETEFTISQWSSGEVDESTKPYCEVDGTILTKDVEYTFDINTNTFTLLTAPALNADVKCGYDFLGEFNESLADDELWVIASGMLYAWTSSKYYRSENLKNRMSSKDFKTFSPAKLLDSLNELRKRAMYELRQDTVRYSFKGFNGFK